MKKVAIGCLGVFGVLFVAGGIVLYVYVLRPAQTMFQGAQQFAQIEEMNEQVQNRSSYSAPESGELTEAQVTRFMQVQRQMRDRLEGRYQELQQKHDELEARRQAEGREVGYRELIDAWSDISGLVVEAKQAQVDALNAHDFSLEEYQWVREQVYLAAGFGAYSASLTEMAQAAEDEREVVVSNRERVPERNVELLEPYRENLEDYLGLAFFGL